MYMVLLHITDKTLTTSSKEVLEGISTAKEFPEDILGISESERAKSRIKPAVEALSPSSIP